MKPHLIALAASVALGACAKHADRIEPAYVATGKYDGWSCERIGPEAERLVAELERKTASQNKTRSRDIAGVLLIGLPVSSMRGDAVAPEVARLKGEVNAIRSASLSKGCGHDIPEVRYDAPPDPETVAKHRQK